MIFNGDFEDWEEDEEHKNKLVFIGKNLDVAALRAAFADCVASPENLEKKLKALRFKVGDRVECKMTGGMWKAGTVAELMWRAEDMAQGQVCPYKVRLLACALGARPRTAYGAACSPQVELDDGGLTWAPIDEDDVIRAKDAKRQRSS